MKRLLIVIAALFCLFSSPAAASCYLPYTLLNGTAADANQVMADLNALAACDVPASGVVWPPVPDIVISNGTDSPAGLAPVNGDCVVGSGGAWVAGSCGGGGSGCGNAVLCDYIEFTGAESSPDSKDIQSLDSVASSGLAGKPLKIATGNGDTAAAGGEMFLSGGTGGGTGGNGGEISITAGNAGATTGTGGTLNLAAGNGGTSSGNGGNLFIASGTNTSGTGGEVSITGGATNSGDAPANSILIQGGAGNSGAGGEVQILGGQSTHTGSAAGEVLIQGGQGPSGGANGPVDIFTNSGSGTIGAFNVTVGATTIAAGQINITGGSTVAATGITMNSNGADMILESVGGSNLDLNSFGSIKVNGTVGVNCSGSPTSSFATSKGIVTHC